MELGQGCETRKFPPEPRVDEALPLLLRKYEASLDGRRFASAESTGKEWDVNSKAGFAPAPRARRTARRPLPHPVAEERPQPSPLRAGMWPGSELQSELCRGETRCPADRRLAI